MLDVGAQSKWGLKMAQNWKIWPLTSIYFLRQRGPIKFSFAFASYNPFVSSAHPPIVRDHANVHKIGSHFPVVADRYPWISPSCHSGFDIAATVRKKMVSKNSRSEYYDYRIFLSLLITHVSCIRLIKLWFLNLHSCNLSIWALLLKIVFINTICSFFFSF